MNRKDMYYKCINCIRFLSADAIQKANSGHPGLPLGAAPAAFTLWNNHLNFKSGNPQWLNRDRFILSAGHGSMLLYSLLHLYGFDVSLEDIKNFRQLDSITPGHPENFVTSGVEATTGPLGQGIANAVGMAIAEAHLSAEFNSPDFPNLIDHHTYVLAGDGDLMEGISYEACALAGHLNLGKLILLYDDNDISLAGSTKLAFTENVTQRFEATNWQILVVSDGNDTEDIDKAIEKAKFNTDQPSLIRVKTQIGFGSPNKSGTFHAHGAPLGTDELKLTKEQLGWPTDRDFYIPEDVKEYFNEISSHKTEMADDWQNNFNEYSQKYPEKAAELKRRIDMELMEDWDKDIQDFTVSDGPIATRKTSEALMQQIADTVPELIGGCADLNPSTFAWLKGLGDFQGKDALKDHIQGKVGGEWSYAGRNIHFGVREHAMGAIAVGIALHGGLIPFTGTFFIFSDYMRPAIRLAALSRLRTIMIFSHDSIGVGEDGPTHQPVEQLVSLRAIPNLNVIRPADANEVIRTWEIALKSKNTPTAMVFSRQKLPILDRNLVESADGVLRGGYKLWQTSPKEVDAILIATGSEVNLAYESALKLSKMGYNIRVVSLPCWEIFEKQDQSYRENVLPPKCKLRVAIEAGVSLGWERYIGNEGIFIGVETFGASAPGNELFKKFGLTVENLVNKTQNLIESEK